MKRVNGVLLVVKCLALVILFVVGGVATYLSITSEHKEQNTVYYRSAEVIDKKGDMCYLEDTTGEVWCVEDENLKLFGRYILQMDSLGTDSIYDDEVLTVQ